MWLEKGRDGWTIRISSSLQYLDDRDTKIYICIYIHISYNACLRGVTDVMLATRRLLGSRAAGSTWTASCSFLCARSPPFSTDASRAWRQVTFAADGVYIHYTCVHTLYIIYICNCLHIRMYRLYLSTCAYTRTGVYVTFHELGLKTAS